MNKLDRRINEVISTLNMYQKTTALSSQEMIEIVWQPVRVVHISNRTLQPIKGKGFLLSVSLLLKLVIYLLRCIKALQLKDLSGLLEFCW